MQSAVQLATISCAHAEHDCSIMPHVSQAGIASFKDVHVTQGSRQRPSHYTLIAIRLAVF